MRVVGQLGGRDRCRIVRHRLRTQLGVGLARPRIFDERNRLVISTDTHQKAKAHLADRPDICLPTLVYNGYDAG